MHYRSWQKDHTYRGFILVKNYSCCVGTGTVQRIEGNGRSVAAVGDGQHCDSLASR